MNLSTSISKLLQVHHHRFVSVIVKILIVITYNFDFYDKQSPSWLIVNILIN